MKTTQRRIMPVGMAVLALALLWLLMPSGGECQEATITYLNLDKADVRSVLRYLAEVSGANIVADHDVEGQVSLHLRDITWRQALDAVLSAQGLTCDESAGVIRVMTMDSYYAKRLERFTQIKQQEDIMALERSVIKVKHAKADDVRKSVEKLLTDRGRIAVDERTNSLVVTDIPSKLPLIE